MKMHPSTGSTFVNDGFHEKQSMRENGIETKAGEDSQRKTVTTDTAAVHRITPNEESLILVLKKVRHPLFRTSWSRKLVDDFQELFPNVKLSGRTFRVLVDKCMTAPPSQSSSDAVAEAGAEAADSPGPTPAVGVASGRRGRKLRQQAIHLASSGATASHAIKPNETPRCQRQEDQS